MHVDRCLPPGRGKTEIQRFRFIFAAYSLVIDSKPSVLCTVLHTQWIMPHHPGSASSRLTHLHWLSVHRRIQYKIAVLTYKSLSTNQPPYLRNLFHIYQPLRCLRSASQNLLSIPFCTTNFGKRSFSFSSPTIWNELLVAIRESNTLDTFKRRLKTHLTSLTTRSV